jgi:hypothetical protein
MDNEASMLAFVGLVRVASGDRTSLGRPRGRPTRSIGQRCGRTADDNARKRMIPCI